MNDSRLNNLTSIGTPHFQAFPQTRLSRSLGGLCFTRCALPVSASLPILFAPLESLNSRTAEAEIWMTENEVTSGSWKNLIYRHDDDVLFGIFKQNDVDPKQSLEEATYSAYLQILGLLSALGYQQLYRCWNYISQINEITEGLERYRKFNKGRHRAFAERLARNAQLPAACALGSEGEGLHIAFLAGKAEFIAIENPRQIRAWNYPEQYGPKSPAFSRAILLSHVARKILSVSGTASIVGHQSYHEGDVQAQTLETITNIEAIVLEANKLLGHSAFDLRQGNYRVYIRHPEHAPVIERLLSQALGPEVNISLLRADICRADLLLEIEATLHESGQY